MNKLLVFLSFIVIVSTSAWAGGEFNPLDAVYKVRGYVMHPIHEKVWEKHPGLKERQKVFINRWFAKSEMPPKIVFKQFQESWLNKENPLGSWSITKKDKNGKKKIVGLIGFRDGSNQGFNYVGGMTPDGRTNQFYWTLSPNFDAGSIKLIKKALSHAFKKVDNLEEVWLGTFATEAWKKILTTDSPESQEKLKDIYSLFASQPQDKVPFQADRAGFKVHAHYPFKPKKGKKKYIAVYKITRDEHKASKSLWNRIRKWFR